MLNYNFTISNNNRNIIIPLNNDVDFIGEENYINESDLVTDVFVDREISKYKLSNNVNLIFYFYNNTYESNFKNAGFTDDDITLNNKGYRYSYILFQVYDNFNANNQTLLHNGYIPLYLFPNNTISQFSININDKYFEFNNIYISNNYKIENNQTLYVNFKFYNAKTGNIQIFNNQLIDVNSEEKLYYKIIVNKEDKTYRFINNNIIAYQFLNQEFINKINERNKNENKSPIFTSGDLFNITGDYE
jgi:hypothetical protein